MVVNTLPPVGHADTIFAHFKDCIAQQRNATQVHHSMARYRQP